MYDLSSVWLGITRTRRTKLALQYDHVSIEVLGLSRRAFNALKRSGRFGTVGDLIRASDDILDVRGLGWGSILEIDAALAPFLTGQQIFADHDVEGDLPTVAPDHGLEQTHLWADVPPATIAATADRLREMPVQAWSMPPDMGTVVTDDLRLTTVGDVLDRAPDLLRTLQHTSGPRADRAKTKLLDTVLLQDPAVIRWLAVRDGPAVAEKLSAADRGEPVFLLALGPTARELCRRAGVSTIGDALVGDDELVGVVLEVLRAIGHRDPAGRIDWAAYWRQCGLTIVPQDLDDDVVTPEMVVSAVRAVLEQREPRKATVISARYGLAGEAQTLLAIATEMGLTRQRVNQLKQRALSELRPALAHEGASIGLTAPVAVVRWVTRLNNVIANQGWITERQAVSTFSPVADGERLIVPVVHLVLDVLGLKRCRPRAVGLPEIWTTGSLTWSPAQALFEIQLLITAADSQPFTTDELCGQLSARGQLLRPNDVAALLRESQLAEEDAVGEWHPQAEPLRKTADWAEKVLLEVGQPIHLSELARIVTARWTTRARTLSVRGLSAALGNDDRFRPLGRSGCWALSTWSDASERPCIGRERPATTRLPRPPRVELSEQDRALLASMHSTEAWQRYDAWNSAVASEFFSGRYSLQPVYIDLEDSALGRVAVEAGASDEDPQLSLIEAVAATLNLQRDGYRTFSRHRLRLRDWLQGDRESPPPCLALLALLSLVAETMHGDAAFAPNNYYDRLADLLRIDRSSDTLRQRLRADYREEVSGFWDALNGWLDDADGARGCATAVAFDRRVHVGLPISQALLRLADRERLREVFVWHRLQARQLVSHQDMDRLIGEWLTKTHEQGSLQRLWSNAATREVMVTAAVIELERWDGSTAEPRATGNDLRLLATVWKLPRPQIHIELGLQASSGYAGSYVLDFERSSENAPAALPEGLSLVPGDDGWLYRNESDVSFPDLLLAQVVLRRPGNPDMITRSPRRLVVMSWADDMKRFEQVDRAELGREVLLLVHQTLGADVEAALERVARPGFRWWSSQQLVGLPEEWLAASNVQIFDMLSTKQDDLGSLVPLGWTTIELGGGMSLPGGSIWLTRRPPEVRVSSVAGRPVSAEIVGHAYDDEEPIQPIPVETVDGRAVRDVTADELPDGDFAVHLWETTRAGHIVASRTFRLRSADSPRRPLADEPAWVGRAVSSGDGWIGLSADSANKVPANGSIVGCRCDRLPSLMSPSSPPPPGRLSDSGASSEDLDNPEEIAATRRRGVAPAACLVGAAHHWMLDPGYPGQRGSEGRCKLCHLEKWFPARPKPAASHKVSSSVSPATPIVHAPPIQVKDAADIDDVMDALSYIGQGSWGAFERVAQPASTEPWYAQDLARLLDSLGHIDLVRDRATLRPVRWRVAPATVAILPGGTEAVLTGFRSARLFAALDELVGNRGELRVESSPGCPSIWSISGLSQGELADLCRDATADAGCSVELAQHVPEKLVAVAPTLSAMRAALPQKSVPMQSKLFRFAWSSSSWVPCQELGEQGAYRVRHRTYSYGYVGRAMEHSGRYLVADSHLVKWLVAVDAGATMMAYDPDSQLLSCRLGAQLPPLHERAAVMCSGRPPVKRKDGTVSYAGVLPSVAAQLWHVLGPEGARSEG